MLSVHTSPLEQPGTGDAGGMNVYVVELAPQLAALGTEVEIFTRATRSEPRRRSSSWRRASWSATSSPARSRASAKNDLPAQLCAFTAGSAAGRGSARARLVRPGPLALLAVRSGRLDRRRALGACRSSSPRTRWPRSRTPRSPKAMPAEPRCPGDRRGAGRRRGGPAGREHRATRRGQLDPALRRRPAAGRRGRARCRPRGLPPRRVASTARTRLGVAPDAHVLLFVGRIQPLKAPDVLLRAAAEMLRRDPSLRDRLVVAVVGGPSGSGLDHPDAAGRARPRAGHRRRRAVRAAGGQDRLADWYRAANVVVVPSHNEIVRAGRARSAGVRHAGRGGRGRRPAHRGARRRLRAARRRPRPGPVRRRRSGALLRDPRAGAQLGQGCAHAMRPPSAGPRPQRTCWRATGTRWTSGTRVPRRAPRGRRRGGARSVHGVVEYGAIEAVAWPTGPTGGGTTWLAHRSRGARADSTG